MQTCTKVALRIAWYMPHVGPPGFWPHWAKFPIFRSFFPHFYNPARPLQESPGPSGPGIPKESQKSLPAPSGPGAQKVSETVSKQSPKSQNRPVLRRRRLFRTLFGNRSRKAGRLFSDSFGVPGPEGPGDSCKGRAGLHPIFAVGPKSIFRPFLPVSGWRAERGPVPGNCRIAMLMRKGRVFSCTTMHLCLHTVTGIG